MFFVAALAVLLLLGLVGLALFGLVRLVIGRGAAGVSLGLAAAGAAIVVVLLAGLVVGRDAGTPEDEPSAGGPPEEESTTTTAPSGGTPLRHPVALLTAGAADRLPAVPPVIGGLADGEVIVVRAVGLDPASNASVHQCPVAAVAPSQCRAGVPATVSEHQQLTVLVDLLERFDARSDRVDCVTRGCSVVVFGSSRLELRTVFGRPAPRPVAVDVEPSKVSPGAEVSATASALPARADVSFAICRPDGVGGADCSSPSVARSDDEGRATARLEVGAGRCGRGDTCAVAVSTEEGVAAYQPLRIIGRPGASYEDGRLVPGLVAAAALLGLALLLLRRTDWTPVEGDPFAGVVLPADPFADDPT